ncbi:hypothetical protein [Hyalangium rubrum]|uniref:Uncharacterized protein n=1 Tax=Hyalangium rubrum TaxID=3103134 RepID=A0ABU5GYN4_9BACT|nr:hypothetical protein [Hyalangium sp. s54d21]MDY7226311.1 hypothetical protein [Hyalangium sp. s54d21]
MNDPPSRDRPWWHYAVIACVTFALPMLMILDLPWHALCAWLIAVLVYLGLLGVFGTRFVIEGGIFVFFLAALMAAVLNVSHHLQERAETASRPPLQTLGLECPTDSGGNA